MDNVKQQSAEDWDVYKSLIEKQDWKSLIASKHILDEEDGVSRWVFLLLRSIYFNLN